MSGIFFYLIILGSLFFFSPLDAVTVGSASSVSVEPLITFSEGKHAINGFAWMKNGFALKDASTTVTFGAVNPVSGIVNLNGGTLVLDQDFILRNPTALKSLGTIKGNHHVLRLCSSVAQLPTPATLYDVQMQLDADLAIVGNTADKIMFNGLCSIHGHGNTIDLSSGGIFVVKKGATLALIDLLLKGIGSGGGNIVLSSHDSELVLSNVTVELTGDVATRVGVVRFKGPGLIVVKDYTWTFDSSGKLVVDGVPLYWDRSAATTRGDILFGSPEKDYLQFKNQGTLKFFGGYRRGNGLTLRATDGCCTDLESRVDLLEFCCDGLQSQVDEAESCCDENTSRVEDLESCCDASDSRLDLVESCCDILLDGDGGGIISRVDDLESCCDANDSRLDLVESCCDILLDGDGGGIISRVEDLESCCDANDSRIEELESCCDENDSRLELVESCCESLGGRIIILDDCCDVNTSRLGIVESCCDANDSRLDLVESCCDILLDGDGGGIISRVEDLESCCDANDSRLDLVESCCDILLDGDGGGIISRVGDLESCCDANTSRIEDLESCCDENDSRLELVELCCESLLDGGGINGGENGDGENGNGNGGGDPGGGGPGIRSRLEDLESCCDENTWRIEDLESCCDANDSRLDLVESCCDIILDGDGGGIISRVDDLESCCDEHDSQIEELESCCDEHDSQIEELESCCDEHDSRLELVESCCESLGGRIIILDDCCDENTSRLGVVESCCDANDSRLDLVESCCDIILDGDGGGIISRVDDLESCCDVNDSRIEELESCCDENDSRLELVESCCESLGGRIIILDDCCDVNTSRLGIVESCCDANDSRLDLVESCCDILLDGDGGGIISRVEDLESCCDANDSRLDLVESCCDILLDGANTTEGEVEIASSNVARVELLNITIVSDELLFDLLLLPGAGETVIFQFESSGDDIPRVIFDPMFFGDDGRVELPSGSSLIFRGNGIVQVKDGVLFDFAASQLVLEDGAILQPDPGATVIFGGQGQRSTNRYGKTDTLFIPDYGTGQLIIRKGAQILVDNPAHIIFGETELNEFTVHVDFGGMLVVDHSDASVSFHAGTFNIEFTNHSVLSIMNGLVELNMLNGQSSPGIIKRLLFAQGARLEVHHSGEAEGVLSLAPNAITLGGTRSHVLPTEFDSRTGVVKGDGRIQFRSFDEKNHIAINTTVRLQKQKIQKQGSIADLFVALGNINRDIQSGSAAIIAQQAQDDQEDRLAVFCPACDGSVVQLEPGDHGVFYDSSEPGGPINVIRGYDRNNKLFEIVHGKVRRT